MSHANYKKWLCRPVEFKTSSCRHVDFRKVPCPLSLSLLIPCRMSLKPRNGRVAVLILGVYTPALVSRAGRGCFPRVGRALGEIKSNPSSCIIHQPGIPWSGPAPPPAWGGLSQTERGLRRGSPCHMSNLEPTLKWIKGLTRVKVETHWALRRKLSSK